MRYAKGEVKIAVAGDPERLRTFGEVSSIKSEARLNIRKDIKEKCGSTVCRAVVSGSVELGDIANVEASCDKRIPVDGSMSAPEPCLLVDTPVTETAAEMSATLNSFLEK